MQLIQYYFYAFTTRQCGQRRYVFICRVRSFVRSFRQILLPRYLMNGFSNLDETYRKYSTALIDDPIKFWRLKVKVRTDVAKTSTSTLGHRSTSASFFLFHQLSFLEFFLSR